MQFERRAIFFPGTRECDWQTSTPETSADKVLLKARLSGISAGTEGMWFDGSASALKSGRKSYPYFPGYEFVGEVVSVGADVPIRAASRACPSLVRATGSSPSSRMRAPTRSPRRTCG